MQMRKAWLIALSLTASPAFAQRSDDLATRHEAVRELFASRGEDKVFEALVTELSHTYVANLHKSHPDISQERLNALQDKIRANMIATKEDYLRHEEDVLSEHMSLDDLHAVTAFYNSPAGKKLAAITPELIPEIGKNQVAWETAAIKQATDDINAAAKSEK